MIEVGVLQELAQCRSTAELHAHPTYRKLAPAIQAVLETLETDDFTPGEPPPKPVYRFVAWNIERGIQLDGQIQAFRCHPYLRSFDVLLLTELDIGMARSGNRHVPQTLAGELGLRYVFGPCYLNLTKGSGLEYHTDGHNQAALHGNAIFSRYPIRRPRLVRLRNGVDKMAGREKRIGSQVAVIADIDLPGLPLTAVSVHLDAQSSQAHRRDQMRQILDSLDDRFPVVLGGDWNTTGYNSSRAIYSILGFWRRVFMGVENVLRHHYLQPWRHFEKELFEMLEQRGFDYRSCNVPDEGTVVYDTSSVATRMSLGEWVPGWCFPFMRWALRNHGFKCPLKIDWFAIRGVRCENRAVIHDLNLSDHDPIGIDVVACH